MNKVFQRVGGINIVIWSILLLAAVFASFEGRWSLAFVALLTLILASAPVFLARWFDIQLPVPFVFAITVFVIGSVFMGEQFDFYERYWWWDIVLHGTSAVGFGMIGFLFVFMLFEGDRFAAPAWAICLMAVCFAISVGVIWEIFEFLMDYLFGLNMQKSGLIDTMTDLIVDLCGALLSASIGYVYLRTPNSNFWSWPLEQFVRLNRRFFQKK